MTRIQQSVEVDVPAATAYDRWTEFEAFGKFVPGIEEVRRLGSDRLRCRARLGSRVMELEAAITEEIPGRRLAWSCEESVPHTGAVTFQPLGADAARVTVQLDGELAGALQAALELGLVDRRISEDLGRFKEMVEAPAWTRLIGQTLPQPPR